MIRLSILFYLIFLVAPLLAQDDEEVNAVGVRFLDYTNDLPPNLLSGRTAVLVSVPTVAVNSPKRGDWKALAEEAHLSFKEMGIDAMLYSNFEDAVNAGPQVSKRFADYLIERQVQNIAVLSQVRLSADGKVDDRYVVVLTPFSGDVDFIKNGQLAYKEQHKKLDRLLKKLSRQVARSDQEFHNNMIIDVPEYFEDVNLIGKRRYEIFASDLKLDKLAVPKFEYVDIPEDRPGGLLNNRIEKEAEDLNRAIRRQNQELVELMKGYPFAWDTVDYSVGEEALWKGGYQYILLKVNTTGENIKEWLGYDYDPSVSTFVTVKQKDGKTILRNIPAEAPVYKYYVKHLYTGDIYLGDSWDADEGWKDAYNNHMRNLVKEIIRGR